MIFVNTLKHLALEKTVFWAIDSKQNNISKLKHIAISLCSPNLKYDFLLELYYDGCYKKICDLLKLWDEFFAPLLISKLDRQYTFTKLYFIFHRVIGSPDNFQSTLRKFMDKITQNYISNKQLCEREIRNFLYLSEFLFDCGWYEENQRLLHNLKNMCVYINVNIDVEQCQLLRFNIQFALLKNHLEEGNISYLNLKAAEKLKNEFLKTLQTNETNNFTFNFLNLMTPTEQKSMEIALLTQFARYEVIKNNLYAAQTYCAQIVEKIVATYKIEEKKNVFTPAEEIHPQILIEGLCISSLVYCQIGQHEKSRILIECAVCKSKYVYSVDHLVYARALRYYGYYLNCLEEHEKSEACYRHIYLLIINHFGASSNIVWVESLMNFTNSKLRLHESQNMNSQIDWITNDDLDMLQKAETDFQTAYSLYLKFIPALENNYSNVTPKGDTYALVPKLRDCIATVKVRLCTTYACKNKYIELLDCKWLVESSLRMAQKIFGNNHILVANINYTIAVVYCKILKFTDHPIISHYNNTLQMAEEHLEKAKSFIFHYKPKNKVDNILMLLNSANLELDFFHRGNPSTLREHNRYLYDENLSTASYKYEQYCLKALDICKEIYSPSSHTLNKIYLKLKSVYSDTTVLDFQTLGSELLLLMDVWKIEKSVDDHEKAGKLCKCVSCPNYSCKTCLKCYCNRANVVLKEENEELNYKEIITPLTI